MLYKINNHYIQDDQLKVAIRNYRKPLRTEEWTTDYWTLEVTFDGQFFPDSLDIIIARVSLDDNRRNGFRIFFII